MRWAAAAGADVFCTQETRTLAKDQAACTRAMRRAAASWSDDGGDAPQSRVTLAPPLVGEAVVGGLMTLTVGEMAARHTGEVADARGWGRYSATTYIGKRGHAMTVVNVYVAFRRRGTVVMDGGSAQAQLTALANAEYVGSNAVRRRRGPNASGLSPITRDDVGSPQHLVLRDISEQFAHLTGDSRNTVVVLGDFNIDKGDSLEAQLQLMANRLGLSEVGAQSTVSTSARDAT